MIVKIQFIERLEKPTLTIEVTLSELEEFGGFNGPPFECGLLSWTDPEEVTSNYSLTEKVIIIPVI